MAHPNTIAIFDYGRTDDDIYFIDIGPVFGGHEVGIGFAGACREDGADLEATALVGKRSLRLTATLKLMRRA